MAGGRDALRQARQPGSDRIGVGHIGRLRLVQITPVGVPQIGLGPAWQTRGCDGRASGRRGLVEGPWPRRPRVGLRGRHGVAGRHGGVVASRGCSRNRAQRFALMRHGRAGVRPRVGHLRIGTRRWTVSGRAGRRRPDVAARVDGGPHPAPASARAGSSRAGSPQAGWPQAGPWAQRRPEAGTPTGRAPAGRRAAAAGAHAARHRAPRSAGLLHGRTGDGSRRGRRGVVRARSVSGGRHGQLPVGLRQLRVNPLACAAPAVRGVAPVRERHGGRRAGGRRWLARRTTRPWRSASRATTSRPIVPTRLAGQRGRAGQPLVRLGQLLGRHADAVVADRDGHALHRRGGRLPGPWCWAARTWSRSPSARPAGGWRRPRPGRRPRSPARTTTLTRLVLLDLLGGGPEQVGDGDRRG